MIKELRRALPSVLCLVGAVLIADAASITVARADDDEPFEVVTSKAIYVTRDGFAHPTRPAFEIQSRSFSTMMIDPRAQLLAHQMTTAIGPRESVMRPLRLGERPIEVRMSEPERRSLLEKTSVSQAAMVARVVTVLLVSDPALLVIAATAIELAKLTEPLEEIINRQAALDEMASRGRYGAVDAGGRVIPSASFTDTVSYVVRHLRAPSSPPVLKAWLFKTVAQWSFGRFLGPSVSLKGILAKAIGGKFLATTVDLIVRDEPRTGSGSSGGGGCYAAPAIPGMMYSMPVLCNQSLTPSLQVAAPPPLVAASAQSIPLQIRAFVPEANTWFAGGAIAVRVIPVAPSTFTVVPSYPSPLNPPAAPAAPDNWPAPSYSPPSNPAPSNEEHRTGAEQESSDEEPSSDEASTPRAEPHHQSLRGLPIGIHVSGDFGGSITFDRHQ